MTTGADRFGVDPWRSEAGERIHPNGSAVGGIAAALDPAPYHRSLGRPAGRAGSPTGRPEQSGRCAACPPKQFGPHVHPRVRPERRCLSAPDPPPDPEPTLARPSSTETYRTTECGPAW